MIGIITFYSSQHAIQAEKALKKAEIEVELIPGPKDISPNCGVALSFSLEDMEKVVQTLSLARVKYEAVHKHEFKKELSMIERLKGH